MSEPASRRPLWAFILSVIFHPLLVPTYMLLTLLWVNPFLFGVPSPGEPLALQTLVMIFLYTFAIPGIAILIMKGLDMIDSITMEDRMDRIGPYLLVGILYLWVYYNLTNQSSIPPIFSAFLLGATIGLFLAFFLNLFTKISAHAVGMGGLSAVVLITALQFSPGSFSLHLFGYDYRVSTTLLLLLTILLAGLVGTSRLRLKAHEPIDVYGGYLVGFAAQFIALRFYF